MMARDLEKAFSLPLQFQPIYKEKIWGGNQISRLPGREAAGEKTGESWEISARDDDSSRVAGGIFDGKSLHGLWKKYPRELLGVDEAPARFPLLVKIIDAADDLSVQVHPDDAYAMEHEHDSGKAECWAVLKAEPGARIQRGLKEGVTHEDFAAAVKEGRVLECLHFLPAEPGQVLAQPSGCVHAIGKGVMLAEFQQNSDVTYRVYDYDRPGLDGKPRPLHVDRALEVIGFDKLGAEFDGDMRSDTICPELVFERGPLSAERLVTGPKFHFARLRLGAGKSLRWPKGLGFTNKGVFEVWMVTEGRLAVRSVSGGSSMEIAAITSVLLPAAADVIVEALEPAVLLWAAPEEFIF